MISPARSDNNLVAAVLTAEALLPRMAEGGIVHIGSTATDRASTPLGAAKAA